MIIVVYLNMIFIMISDIVYVVSLGIICVLSLEIIFVMSLGFMILDTRLQRSLCFHLNPSLMPSHPRLPHPKPTSD